MLDVLRNAEPQRRATSRTTTVSCQAASMCVRGTPTSYRHRSTIASSPGQESSAFGER